MPTAFHEYRRGLWLALAGIIVLSFDALLIRMAQSPPADVAFWRGALIAAALALVQWGRQGGLRLSAITSRAAIVAVVLFGINTVLFVFSLSYTSVANTIILLSLAPLFAAFLSRFVTGERIATDTWLTAVVTVLGVALVVGGSAQSTRWVGDALALLASLVVAGALTALRCSPDVERIPVIMCSGVVTAALMIPWAAPLALDAASYPPLLTMGLLQIPLAMVLLAVATRYVSAPEVGLVMLLEIILGPLWVWLLLAETAPRASVYGGIVVLLALLAYFGRRLQSGPDV